MAKRWRKQKSALQQTKHRKQKQGDGESNKAGGTLGGLRSFTKGFFSGGKTKKPKTLIAKIFDGLLWVAIAVAVYFLIARRCTN
ncbi:MAG: hypothetical protein JW841_15910 [Deltaproteobacteria bacterium]|nr:hypothetical protein [Deltaproteobacteria bacterium]